MVTWNVNYGWLIRTLSGSYANKHSFQEELLGKRIAAYSMSVRWSYIEQQTLPRDMIFMELNLQISLRMKPLLRLSSLMNILRYAYLWKRGKYFETLKPT